eukprot:gene505-275_t
MFNVFFSGSALRLSTFFDDCALALCTAVKCLHCACASGDLFICTYYLIILFFILFYYYYSYYYYTIIILLSASVSFQTYTLPPLLLNLFLAVSSGNDQAVLWAYISPPLSANGHRGSIIETPDDVCLLITHIDC